MLYWIPYAFVRITVFFVAGILTAVFFPELFSIPWLSVVSLTLVGIFFAIWFLNRWYKRRLINPGLVGLAAIFCCGYLNVYLEDDSYQDTFFKKSAPFSFYVARVSGEVQETDYTWRQVIEIECTKHDATWRMGSGHILLSYNKETYPQPFRYGDVLLIQGQPADVQGAMNPGEFDYKRYLRFKNIHGRHVIREHAIQLVESRPSNQILAMAFEMRTWASRKIREAIHSPQERAIASALVLGVTDELDNDLMNAYSATGAMHVLSVSGLHVGIVYLLIGFFLKPFNKIKNGKWWIASIAVLALWLYACVTGLSPSVLRAVTMFSFVAIARPLNHRTNIYNTLAASAFCILLFDPYLIMSVGFQLSYLAVLGIVALHSPMYNALQIENRILDEVWKISCVSFAAQIATLSLSIFYFHQFPNYFFVTNLFVIPMGFVILVGGLALLAVSFSTVIAGWIGFILEWVIRIMNKLIFAVEAMPFSQITNIYLTEVQCIVIMLLIVCIVLLLLQKKIAYGYASAFMVLLLGISAWMSPGALSRAERLYVYHLPRTTAFDIVSEDRAFSFIQGQEDEPEKIDADVKRHILPNRLRHGVSTVYNTSNQSFWRNIQGGHLIVRNGKCILQLETMPVDLPAGFQTDILILSGKAIWKWEEILKKINPGKIILDSSNSYFVADKVLRSLPKHYQIHSVPHHGAFDIII